MPLGGLEVVIVLVIILLFFGAKRVPELARSLGLGARELKKAAREDGDENQAKEPGSVEAREAGEETGPKQEQDAPPRGTEPEGRTEPKG